MHSKNKCLSLFCAQVLQFPLQKQLLLSVFIIVVQLLSCVWFFAILAWIAARQAPLHYLPEFAQTHIHWVGDAIQLILCHPFNLSQHQGPFQWVGSLHQVAKQSIGASASASVLPMNVQGWFHLGLTDLISENHKCVCVSVCTWKNTNGHIIYTVFNCVLLRVYFRVYFLNIYCMGWGSFEKQKNFVPIQPWSFTSDQTAPYLQLFCFFFTDSVVPGRPEAVLLRETSWHGTGKELTSLPDFTGIHVPHSYGIPYIWNLFSEFIWEIPAPSSYLATQFFFPPRSCRWVKCFLGVVEVISQSCISGSWREAGRGCV